MFSSAPPFYGVAPFAPYPPDPGSSVFGSTTPFNANLGNPASTTSTYWGTTAQTSCSRTNSTATTPVNELCEKFFSSCNLSSCNLKKPMNGLKDTEDDLKERISFFSSCNLKKPMNGLKDTEDDLKERISFLSGFVVAFKEQTHTDIQLKPNNGQCIPAHKALLAARSEIFKNMLGSDSCKAQPSDTDTITLSELNTEELESLLEFLYTGNLSLDKLEKHVFALYVAADKYEIPYLQKSCERYMLNSLNTSNAVDILEISDAHSNKTLKETTMQFIVRNMKDIVSSQKYEDFASSNPHLCVQMTRALFDAKSHQIS